MIFLNLEIWFKSRKVIAVVKKFVQDPHSRNYVGNEIVN